MFIAIGTLIGGLGLFMLAVHMITEGLKFAAGNGLRDLLARSTATRLRGVLSGILLTGIVQSSSAVTLATIGFVNAGLLTLTQAIGVVFGANIGTTLTGWIIALVGFNFRVEVFALPLLGAGMFTSLLAGKGSRLAAAGEAVAGFGLFFIGIDFLREAFTGISALLELDAIQAEGFFGTLMFVGFGFLMTLLTQSSSAAIALTLTAATGGVMQLSAAAAVVIGANLGTTSTAAFAAIGATPNARRVAAAHVLFNILTATVAMLLLPLMLAFVRITGDLLGLEETPSVVLALFHTVFNVLGVILIWPFTSRLGEYLTRHFRTSAETLGQPKYLDRSVAVSPSLALDAVKLELQHLVSLTLNYAQTALDDVDDDLRELENRHHALNNLLDTIDDFVSRLEAERLTREAAAELTMVLRVLNYIREINTLVDEVARRDRTLEHGAPGSPAATVQNYRNEISRLLTDLEQSPDGLSVVAAQERYVLLVQQWRQLKTVLLEAAATHVVPVNRLNNAIENLRHMLRICERMVKTVERLQELNAVVAANPKLVAAAATAAADPAAPTAPESTTNIASPAADAVRPTDSTVDTVTPSTADDKS